MMNIVIVIVLVLVIKLVAMVSDPKCKADRSHSDWRCDEGSFARLHVWLKPEALKNREPKLGA